jgi:hypothetical protein
MSRPAFYNGILYQIEYQPQLSNSDYTQHKVYHIKTDDENYPHAQFICPNCGEPFDGHECENCKYTEER